MEHQVFDVFLGGLQALRGSHLHIALHFGLEIFRFLLCRVQDGLRFFAGGGKDFFRLFIRLGEDGFSFFLSLGQPFLIEPVRQFLKFIFHYEMWLFS